MTKSKTMPGGALLLVLLMLIYAVNQLDRNILGIALPGIRAEFHLGDGALGLLTGPAFALIYVLLGVPMAVLADRGHRRAVIAGSLAVFSVMTMLCGMAGNFTQLVAARFGVGLGEAGSAPSLTSLISARFAPQERTGALSFCSAGANLGLLFAFFGGGLVVQHWGWRAALTVAGVPGLLLMVLFLLSWHEPVQQAAPPRAPLGETLRLLWSRKSFRLLALGGGLASIGGFSSLAFVPSFLQRSHHMTPTQVGLLLAILVGVGGFFGTMLPGQLTRGLGQRGGLTVAASCLLFWIPGHLLLCLADDPRVMMTGLAMGAFFVSSWLGPVLASVQNVVPENMRAQSAALLVAAINLLGMTAGPPLVGFASDLMRHGLGEESLRYALAWTTAPALVAAWCFAAARRHVLEETA